MYELYRQRMSLQTLGFRFKFLLKSRFIIPFRSNMQRVEIEIITACNFKCFNCDRSCAQAPSTERMSVDQIRHFVEESLDLDWKWTYVGLIGGEPTLHPELLDIIRVLERYRSRRTDCAVEVLTNGYGPRAERVLESLPDWVSVRNSKRRTSVNNFVRFHEAPLDSPRWRDAPFSMGCHVTEFCGLGLTRNGFYPCGAGGSIDRVFGLDVGIKSLAKVDRKALRRQKIRLCALCGHFKARSRSDFSWEQVVSPTWRRALDAYRKRRPLLETYGAASGDDAGKERGGSKGGSGTRAT